MTDKMELRLQVHMVLCWDALPAEIAEAWGIIELSPARERFKDGQAQMNWKKDGCTYLGTLDSVREVQDPIEPLPAAVPHVPEVSDNGPFGTYGPPSKPRISKDEAKALQTISEWARAGKPTDDAHTRVDKPEGWAETDLGLRYPTDQAPIGPLTPTQWPYRSDKHTAKLDEELEGS